MKQSLLILILLIQIFSAGTGFSQSLTHEGTDFWLAFTKTKNGAGTVTWPAMYRVCITSKLGATGTVSIPGTGFSSGYTVAPGQFDTIVIPGADATNLTSEVIQSQGIHITSSSPVSAYAYSYHLDRYEASLVLPNSSLGSEYMISTYKNSYAPLFQGESEFVIVASGAPCTVEIITTSDTQGGNLAGVPWVVTLASGEIYQVSANIAGGNDLTGSTVKATNGTDKFAVYSGHVFCAIGATNYKDWLYEVEYPINTWGKEYVAIPTIGQDYNLYRVMARENGTTIYVDGTSKGVFNAGQFYEDTLYATTFITGSEPIIVSQFMTSGLASVAGDGDPSLGLLNSNRQMLLDSVLFMADTTAYRPVDDPLQNFVSIVTRSVDTSITYLNGIALTNWQILPQNPMYSYHSREVHHGANYLTTTGCGFLAYSYSLCFAGSHFNSAGAHLDPINDSITSLNTSTGLSSYCPGDSIDFNTSTTGNVLSYSWDLGDGTTSTQATPTHAYLTPNTYPISVILSYNCYSDTLLDTISVIACCSGDSLGFTFTYPDPCDSSIVQFTATSTGQIDSVEWYMGFPGASGLTDTVPVVNFPIPVSYNINLWVYGACGWHDTTIVFNLVYDNPVENYQLNSYDHNYCLGDTIADLTVTDTSGSGGIISWYSDPGLTVNIGTGISVPPNTALGSYTYYIVETLACGDRLLDSVLININNCSSCPVNLVTNPGFEAFTTCPLGTGSNEIDHAVPWDNPPPNPNQSSTDLHNYCYSGALGTIPHTGNGYAGIVTYANGSEYREYAQAPLSQPLIAGKCYQASMYITMAETSQYTVDSMGIGFSNGALLQGVPGGTSLPGQGLILGSAQVSNDGSVDLTSYEWQLMSGQFKANGGEDYITIGNFTPNVNLSPVFIGLFLSYGIYYIDDVCLYEIPNDTINEDLIGDTSACSVISLSGSPAYNDFAWYDSGNTLLSTTQNFTATSTGTYILYSLDSTLCAKTYYRDTISVVISSSIPNTLVNESICPTDSIFLQGAFQDTAGVYYDTLYSTFGCDSIVTTDLTILPLATSTTTLAECTGFNVTVNGNVYSSTGIYIDTLVGASASGCDSIVTTDLTINSVPTIPLSSTGSYCQGDSLLLDAGNTGADFLWSPGGDTLQTMYASAPGNYSVWVSDLNGCSDSASITVSEVATPNVTLTGDTSICIGDSSELISINGAVIWNTGDTSATISVSPIISGWYSAALSNSCGSSTDSIYVAINQLPVASAGNDTIVMPLDDFILNASGGVSYSWSPTTGLSCDNCPNPTASIEANTVYCVAVTDSNGCRSNDCVAITIDASGEVWAPNIFSPNGDALNDVFYIRGSIQSDDFVLMIFNRWGEKVFETSDPAQGWDGTQNGKQLNTAVFVYTASGTTWGGTEFTLQGNITRLAK